MVGNILKSTLESYHYKKLKINDSVSPKTFAQYIKKIDFGKQFLLQKNVVSLEKYQFELDDFMITGNNKIVDDSQEMINDGVKRAEKFRKVFSKRV